MTQEELEALKAEVDQKIAHLHADIDRTEAGILAKIDKVYESELMKTLETINKRLSSIEQRFEDMNADKEEG